LIICGLSAAFYGSIPEVEPQDRMTHMMEKQKNDNLNAIAEEEHDCLCKKNS
jgi:hypothetical protein